MLSVFWHKQLHRSPIFTSSNNAACLQTTWPQCNLPPSLLQTLQCSVTSNTNKSTYLPHPHLPKINLLCTFCHQQPHLIPASHPQKQGCKSSVTNNFTNLTSSPFLHKQLHQSPTFTSSSNSPIFPPSPLPQPHLYPTFGSSSKNNFTSLPPLPLPLQTTSQTSSISHLISFPQATLPISHPHIFLNFTNLPTFTSSSTTYIPLSPLPQETISPISRPYLCLYQHHIQKISHPQFFLTFTDLKPSTLPQLHQSSSITSSSTNTFTDLPPLPLPPKTTSLISLPHLFLRKQLHQSSSLTSSSTNNFTDLPPSPLPVQTASPISLPHLFLHKQRH